MSAGSKFHSCGEETEKPLFPDRSFRYRRDQELNPGRRPKVAPCWNVSHGVAQLNQVLWCTASQAVACDGVKFVSYTKRNREPVKVTPNCS